MDDVARIKKVCDDWQNYVVTAISSLIKARDSGERAWEAEANKLINVLFYSYRQVAVFKERMPLFERFWAGDIQFTETKFAGEKWKEVGDRCRDELADWKNTHGKRFMQADSLKKLKPAAFKKEVIESFETLKENVAFDQVEDRKHRRVARALHNALAYTLEVLNEKEG